MKCLGTVWSVPAYAIAKGPGLLGKDEIECYVLSTKERALSYSQAVKLITGIEGSGQLGTYIDVSGLKSLISKNTVVGETIDFVIPGNPTMARGIKSYPGVQLNKSE